MDPHLRRLYCPKRHKYLHLSGKGFVSGTDFAWSGRIRNANTLAERNPELTDCILLPLNFAHTPSEATK
jgi:hypothetical protein